ARAFRDVDEDAAVAMRYHGFSPEAGRPAIVAPALPCSLSACCAPLARVRPVTTKPLRPSTEKLSRRCLTVAFTASCPLASALAAAAGAGAKVCSTGSTELLTLASASPIR